MTVEEARSIALAVLDSSRHPLTITSVTAKPYGWLFGYQATAYVETGDTRRRLVGIAPLVVLADGRAISLSPPLFQKTVAKLDSFFTQYGNVEEVVKTLGPYVVDIRRPTSR